MLLITAAMEFEKLSEVEFNLLEQKGYQFVVSSNISGILSEGDDVHNLFTLFKTKEAAEGFVGTQKDIYLLDWETAKQEIVQSSAERTGISFFVDKKYK